MHQVNLKKRTVQYSCKLSYIIGHMISKFKPLKTHINQFFIDLDKLQKKSKHAIIQLKLFILHTCHAYKKDL